MKKIKKNKKTIKRKTSKKFNIKNKSPMKVNPNKIKKHKKLLKLHRSNKKLKSTKKSKMEKRDLSKLDRGYRALYKRVNIIESIKKEIKQNAKLKKHPPLSSFSAAEVNNAISMIKNNSDATEYLKKNVSNLTLEVLSMLSEPMIDDKIAESLNIKINAVRRILNILQNYGITNYYIAKNANGWLSFAWYINADKVPGFIESITTHENKKVEIDESCNDYFICSDCYKNTRMIYPFDVAYENAFKCNICNSKLTQIDRSEVENMMNSEIESKA
jgi:transcription initiation factor TFIIE subunit alpha